jgi:hypothetical protein
MRYLLSEGRCYENSTALFLFAIDLIFINYEYLIDPINLQILKIKLCETVLK